MPEVICAFDNTRLQIHDGRLLPSAVDVGQHSQVSLLLSFEGHHEVVRRNDALPLLIDVAHDNVVQTYRKEPQ